MRTPALILLYATACSVAYCASFDCQLATRAQEKFICQNDSISKLDDEVSMAYRAQMRSLSSDAQPAVLAAQRSWLAYWPRICSTSPTSVVLGPEAIECVSTQYRSRVKELNVLPVAPGRTSYTVSEYRILAPKTADETMAIHTISFPQLTNKTSSDVLLNNWMARDIRQWRSGLDSDSNSDLTVTLTKVTSELIQTTETASFEGHGAAHPQMNVLYHYFLPSSGRVMQATDFFIGSRWVDVVAQHVYAKLQKKLGEQLLIKRAEELFPLISETSNWSIGNGTFSLEFNPYQVAPYSEGFVQVEIPMNLIRSYLTPFARGRLAL